MATTLPFRQQKPRELGSGQYKPDRTKQNAQQTSRAASADEPVLQNRELVENALRLFDLEGQYGPCTGMTRLQRYERAEKLGLKPDPLVKRALEVHPDLNDCIWHGRL